MGADVETPADTDMSPTSNPSPPAASPPPASSPPPTSGSSPPPSNDACTDSQPPALVSSDIDVGTDGIHARAAVADLPVLDVDVGLDLGDLHLGCLGCLDPGSVVGGVDPGSLVEGLDPGGLVGGIDPGGLVGGVVDLVGLDVGDILHC